MRQAAAVAVICIVVAGCGSTADHHGVVSVSATAAGSPVSSPRSSLLIVVADPSPNAGTGRQVVVRLIRLDGTEADTFTLKPGVEVLAAAGQRVFVRSGTHLKAIRRDGGVEDLADLGSESTGRVVASPDGRRWLWSTYLVNGDMVHSQVHLGGLGMDPVVVEDSTEEHRVLEPFSWTALGAFVAHSAMGIGGHILFNTASGPVDRLDPVNWTATALEKTSSCSFSDQSRDGTLACLTRDGAEPYLELVAASGKVRTLRLSQPAFNQNGDAFFDASGDRLALGGAMGEEAAAERFSTALVRPAEPSMSSFGPAGVRPAMGQASWLPDGRLVAWRPVGAVGGPAGLYLLGPEGAGPEIPMKGTPIGYLAG